MNTGSPRELLIDCLRVEDPATTSMLEALSRDEWLQVIDEAVKHDVTPLVHQRAINMRVPAEASRRLQEGARANAVRNLRVYHMLSEALTALTERDIPVIVLKGAYLAQHVYKNIAVRSMNDVDLLVRQSDIEAAKACLLNIGYSDLKKPFVPAAVYSSAPHINPLVNRHGVPVELHWTLETGPFLVDIAGVWLRAKRTSVAGATVLALSPEDLLLHVCLHIAFHHRFNQGLRPLLDVARIIEHQGRDIDWQQLASRARSWRIGKHVYLTLRLAQELLGAAVPPDLLTTLKPVDFDPILLAIANAEILFEEEEMSPRFARMVYAARPLERLSLIAQSVFPPAREIARQYGIPRRRRLIYLLYAKRWKDLLLKYGASAWRCLTGPESEAAALRKGQERGFFMDWLHSVD